MALKTGQSASSRAQSKMKTRAKPKSEKISMSALSFALNEREDLPRCAISSAGVIIHANEDFWNLSGLDAALAGQAKAGEVFHFDAKRVGFEDLRNFKSGVYQLNLGVPERQKLETSFQFDWLTGADGEAYLLASCVPGPAENIQSQPDVSISGGIEHVEDLRQFMEMSHDIMLVCGMDGRILRANQAFCSIFGYGEEDMDSLNLLDLFVEDDKPFARASLQSLAREEDEDSCMVNFESRVLTKTRGRRWVEWRQRKSGEFVYSSGRDITETKQKQDDLDRQQQKLSEAESIGRMGHWQWIIGEEEISWSDEIYRIFGVKRGDFSPSINTLTSRVHKRDVGRVVQAFQRAIIEENDYDMEFRIVRPGGDVRYIHCEGRCEKDAGGEVIALYGIMQDMTERMLYEQELREAKESSEHAYATKSQFLANMSHELRTPLNAIIGFSEMIQRQLLGPIGTEKYLEYIAGIRESGEHLLDLISDILDMSKIEAGKYELDLEEVHVSKVIKLALHMIQGRAEDSGIKLRSELLFRDDLTIIADRRALLQIMLNLLSNAVKFTNEGGEVRVECFEREQHITIRVCDTGIGIPANKLASITRPFEQASSHYTREHEGTGLGLSITKNLVELHHGVLGIESTVGVGTNVSVRLPYDAAKKNALRTETSEEDY